MPLHTSKGASVHIPLLIAYYQPICSLRTINMQPNSKMKLSHTETSFHHFDQYPFWLKRDDLLHPQFSGNKARKLAALLDIDASQYNTLIGYGSVQANSLYSLAALAKLKSWQLEFYVDRIPAWLQQTPTGNYRAALEVQQRLGGAILGDADLTTGDVDELGPLLGGFVDPAEGLQSLSMA